jgi:hypothetical protein
MSTKKKEIFITVLGNRLEFNNEVDLNILDNQFRYDVYEVQKYSLLSIEGVYEFVKKVIQDVFEYEVVETSSMFSHEIKIHIDEYEFKVDGNNLVTKDGDVVMYLNSEYSNTTLLSRIFDAMLKIRQVDLKEDFLDKILNRIVKVFTNNYKELGVSLDEIIKGEPDFELKRINDYLYHFDCYFFNYRNFYIKVDGLVVVDIMFCEHEGEVYYSGHEYMEDIDKQVERLSVIKKQLQIFKDELLGLTI